MKIENADPKLILVNTPNGGTQWKLEGDYFFHWEFDGAWYRFMIPDGFRSDGASVPAWLRWIADRGRFGKLAPLVHDYLHYVKGQAGVLVLLGSHWMEHYEMKKTVGGFEKPVRPKFTRKQADKLFFRIMSDQGVTPKWLRRGAYKAVRLLSRLKGDRWT